MFADNADPRIASSLIKKFIIDYYIYIYHVENVPGLKIFLKNRLSLFSVSNNHHHHHHDHYLAKDCAHHHIYDHYQSYYHHSIIIIIVIITTTTTIIIIMLMYYAVKYLYMY